MDRFEKYIVQHLFLLVSENTLPNYVAPKLLLSEEGTTYLIHTDGTQDPAKRLKRVLDAEGINAELVSLGNSDSDAFHIQEGIRRWFPPEGSIGLNYTGGTKAMAVHAYQTVLKKYPNAVFSYLDPRRLSMCIDE